MKYAEQQRQIVSLCRKYRDVKVAFTKNRPWCIIRVNDNEFFFGWSSSIDEVSKWLSENATLKSKSAPRQRKPAKVKRHIGLTPEQWAKVDAYAKELGITKTAVISGMVDNLQTLLPNTCKYCAYENSCSYASPTHGECSDCIKKEVLIL